MKNSADRSDSNAGFAMMSVMFWFRDLFSPPGRILEEAGIREGQSILDYGCGPGGFAIAGARTVGPSGMVYALDIHPMALRQVNTRARKRKLHNVELIQSDCDTGLPDGRLDVVLLYDTFHDLERPGAVLAELHRVLKPGGILSFSDHHLKDDQILSHVTGSGLFELKSRGRKTYAFVKKS